MAFAFDGWKAIPDRRQLIAPDGTDVTLTGGEFKLLSVFLKNSGRVLSRQQLMDVTHGVGWHAYERTIDAQISRLRKKLEVRSKTAEIAKVSAWRRLCLHGECDETARTRRVVVKRLHARVKFFNPLSNSSAATMGVHFFCSFAM